jgi:uncharacterized membrane protein
MASDTTRRSHHERFRQRAEQDYAVNASPEPGRELIHIAAALDFIAFRMGRIDDKLGHMIELLEQRQAGK